MTDRRARLSGDAEGTWTETGTREIKDELRNPFRRDRYDRMVRLVVALRRSDGPLFEGPVRYLVAVGEIEGRPYDISSLAAALDLPRTTLHRCIEEMIHAGTVRTERAGRRTLLYLTDTGWQRVGRNWDRYDPLIDELVLNQIRYLRPRGPGGA